MLLSTCPLKMYEDLAQKNPEIMFYFFTELSCSELSSASYCHQMNIKNQSRRSVMTSEICFKIRKVGKQME